VRPVSEGGDLLSALALVPRFPVPLFSAAFPGGVAGFIHRDFAALYAVVPVVAFGSLAVFALRDRTARAGPDPAPAGEATPGTSGCAPLRPDEELALVGVVLAAMADWLEHDPARFPLLACAASRLVPERSDTAEPRRWAGLTERARRAAVEVLRPTALDTLVRAAVWAAQSSPEQP
jgi:hypothetical protein